MTIQTPRYIAAFLSDKFNNGKHLFHYCENIRSSLKNYYKHELKLWDGWNMNKDENWYKDNPCDSLIVSEAIKGMENLGQS